MVKIGLDEEKVITPIKKMINKVKMHYYTIEELNEINLLIAKLTLIAEKVKDQEDKSRSI